MNFSAKNPQPDPTLKATRQRVLVYRELVSRADNPTAVMLHDAVHARADRVSASTLYIVLEALVRVRLVQEISCGGATPRSCANAAWHAQLYSQRECAPQDVWLPPEMIDALRRSVPQGFEVSRGHLTLVGTRRAFAGRAAADLDALITNRPA